MDTPYHGLSTSSVYRIGDLTVDIGQVHVSRAGTELKLPRLSFDLLVALIEAAPAVATTDYLLERVWPGLVVNAETVTQRVKLLRAALGEDPKLPRYISVVRGRGYRLLPVVEKANSALPEVRVSPALDGRAAVVRRLRLTIAICTLVLVGFVTVTLIRGSVGRPAGRVAPQAVSQTSLPARTVAVLPFESRGPRAREDAYLASGFADSVLHELAVTPQITVIARRSSFAYEDRNVDVREIGRQLNARYLLEGTLQRTSRQMRISADLVDAVTGLSVWSVSFDRPLQQLTAVQDEIAAKVARALQVTMNAGADEQRRPPGTANFEAYLENLQARELAESYRSPDLDAAIAHYQRAIELDPAFSAAYSGLAWAKIQKVLYRKTDSANSDWRNLQRELRPYVQKALDLDNRNADAWQTLAALEEDLDRSELYDRRAVTLEPNLARAQFDLAETVLKKALESAPQRLDEVRELIGKAMALDPLEPRYPSELSEFYLFFYSSQIERAVPLVNQALALDPTYFPALHVLAEVHVLAQQQLAEAVRAGEDAVARDPESTKVRSLLINCYLALGDLPAAEQLLPASSANTSDWLSIFYHRQEWSKAAQIMYDPLRRASVLGGASYLSGEFAVRMDAQNPLHLKQAMAYLTDDADVTWNGDVPSMPLPLVLMGESAISLADLLQRSGNPVRARRLLELVLTSMDTVSTKYKRGEFWFSLQRARALCLLGRKQEALAALELVPTSGWAINWREVEIDPAYDSIRHEARFDAFLNGAREHVAREYAKLEDMRANGYIPDRHRLASR